MGPYRNAPFFRNFLNGRIAFQNDQFNGLSRLQQPSDIMSKNQNQNQNQNLINQNIGSPQNDLADLKKIASMQVGPHFLKTSHSYSSNCNCR